MHLNYTLAYQSTHYLYFLYHASKSVILNHLVTYISLLQFKYPSPVLSLPTCIISNFSSLTSCSSTVATSSYAMKICACVEERFCVFLTLVLDRDEKSASCFNHWKNCQITTEGVVLAWSPSQSTQWQI
jgi:hypothetical protein